MVGKKVRHQPNRARLSEHRHAERVAEGVGTVVDEKQRKYDKTTGRGAWNVAVELWVPAAPRFVGVEVEINGGDCERGRQARA